MLYCIGVVRNTDPELLAEAVLIPSPGLIVSLTASQLVRIKRSRIPRLIIGKTVQFQVSSVLNYYAKMQLSAFVFFAVFGAALARPPPAPVDPCPSVRDKLVVSVPSRKGAQVNRYRRADCCFCSVTTLSFNTGSVLS